MVSFDFIPAVQYMMYFIYIFLPFVFLLCCSRESASADFKAWCYEEKKTFRRSFVVSEIRVLKYLLLRFLWLVFNLSCRRSSTTSIGL